MAPVYNYGCYEATKNTFGIMVYQEQFMSVAHTLGGFDLGKTDYLRKAIGKKKADLMATLKADFIAGAVGNGCPDYEAEENLAQDRGSREIFVQPFPCRGIRPYSLLRGMAQGQLPLGILHGGIAMGGRQGDSFVDGGDGTLLVGQDRAAGHQPLRDGVLHRLCHR